MFSKRKDFKDAKNKQLEKVQQRLRQQMLMKKRTKEMIESRKVKLAIKQEEQDRKQQELDDEWKAYKRREERKKLRQEKRALRATRSPKARPKSQLMIEGGDQKNQLMIEDTDLDGFQTEKEKCIFEMKQISDVEDLMGVMDR